MVKRANIIYTCIAAVSAYIGYCTCMIWLGIARQLMSVRQSKCDFSALPELELCFISTWLYVSHRSNKDLNN